MPRSYLQLQLDHSAMIRFKGLFSGRGSRYTVGPLPLQRSAIAPAEFREVSAGHYFIDFGRVAFAGLELTIPEPEHGRIVTVRMGEAKTGAYQIDRAAGVS